MVKRLKNKTKFIKINSAKSFKDFDKVSDFRAWFTEINSKKYKNN